MDKDKKKYSNEEMEDLMYKFEHIKDYSRDEAIEVMKEILRADFLCISFMTKNTKTGEISNGPSGVNEAINMYGIDRVAEMVVDSILNNSSKLVTMDREEAEEALEAYKNGTATPEQEEFISALKNKIHDDVHDNIIKGVTAGLGFVQAHTNARIDLQHYLTITTIIASMSVDKQHPETIDSGSCLLEMGKEILEHLKEHMCDEDGNKMPAHKMMIGLLSAANLLSIETNTEMVDIREVAEAMKLPNSFINDMFPEEEKTKKAKKVSPTKKQDDLDFLNGVSKTGEEKDNQPGLRNKTTVKKAKQIKPTNKQMKDMLKDD